MLATGSLETVPNQATRTDAIIQPEEKGECSGVILPQPDSPTKCVECSSLSAKNQELNNTVKKLLRLLQVRDNKLRKYKRKGRNSQFKLLQILLKYFVFNYDVLNRYISASYLKIYIVRLIVRKLENASKQVGDVPQKRVRVKSFGASDKMIEDCEESDFEMGGEFDVEELDVEEELEVGEELDVEQSQASTSSSQYTTGSTESTEEDHSSDDNDNR